MIFYHILAIISLVHVETYGLVLVRRVTFIREGGSFCSMKNCNQTDGKEDYDYLIKNNNNNNLSNWVDNCDKV